MATSAQSTDVSATNPNLQTTPVVENDCPQKLDKTLDALEAVRAERDALKTELKAQQNETKSVQAENATLKDSNKRLEKNNEYLARVKCDETTFLFIFKKKECKFK